MFIIDEHEHIHRNRRLRVITISQLVGDRVYKTSNPGLSLSGTSLDLAWRTGSLAYLSGRRAFPCPRTGFYSDLDLSVGRASV